MSGNVWRGRSGPSGHAGCSTTGWWAGVAAAAVGAAFAPDWYLIVLAVLAAWGGLWIGLRRQSLPWSRAMVAGVAVQVLARLGSVEFFGLTSIIGIVVMLALAVLGMRRRPRKVRKVMYFGAAGVAAGVSTLGVP